MGQMKRVSAVNRRVDALFLRAIINGGMGYARDVPREWVRRLPLERLLPELRRIVRRWQSGSAERKRRRTANYTRDRGESSGSGAEGDLPEPHGDSD